MAQMLKATLTTKKEKKSIDANQAGELVPASPQAKDQKDLCFQGVAKNVPEAFHYIWHQRVSNYLYRQSSHVLR